MRIHPRFLRASSRWAEAEYAYDRQQWATAYALYKQALSLYQEGQDWSSHSATYRTFQRLCSVAEHLMDWSQMAEYAHALLGYEQRPFFIGQGQMARTLLLIGRAERHCLRIEIARFALAESVRSTATMIEQNFLEIDDQDDDERSYVQPRLPSNIALLHAEALNEWGLLEGTVGDMQASIALMMLGRLTRDQMIDSI